MQLSPSIIHIFEKSHFEGQGDCGVIAHYTGKQTLTGYSKTMMTMDIDNSEDNACK